MEFSHCLSVSPRSLGLSHLTRASGTTRSRRETAAGSWGWEDDLSKVLAIERRTRKGFVGMDLSRANDKTW